MAQQPSYFDRMKMGLMMGGAVGATMGFLLGGVQVLVYGPGPKGYLRSVGSSMLQSATFFGSLMAIGSLIRSQEANNRFLLTDRVIKQDFNREKELRNLLSYNPDTEN
ncbi:putative mitochondrial genome maintenance protein Mgr2 [Neoconidiobolus thromboides FSU 785]|nr:putative mitochondrial genome maintenance protein Mgr2 [Neoconidiobolus thromboides FSU 785]